MDFKKQKYRSGAMLIASLLFFIGVGKAQLFQPFPDSNAVWTIGVYDVFGSFHYGYSYRLDAHQTDTMIGSGVYKKIFLCDSIGISYKGAYRQDPGRKVFFVPKDLTSERLLYDFGANIGDTVHDVYSEYNVTEPVHNEEILDVDSVAIDGAYHRRLLLHLNFYWIEGIGCNGGLLEPTYGGTFAYVYKIDCFMKDSVPVYSSSTGNCLQSGIPETTPQNISCSVYPNPGNGNFIFKYELPPGKKWMLYLYNTLGACVFQTAVDADKTELCLDISNLGTGIYFYKIAADDLLITDKLIIEK
ncbi:MAG: hypothetical protein JWP12_526 [Bacteroidetes bacterium]|nr:hypothetical protein [Bacteroidota bacterium]